MNLQALALAVQLLGNLNYGSGSIYNGLDPETYYGGHSTINVNNERGQMAEMMRLQLILQRQQIFMNHQRDIRDSMQSIGTSANQFACAMQSVTCVK